MFLGVGVGVGMRLYNRPTFTPAEITTALWLDAADDAAITRNGAGLVSQWSDKSGNGRHAVQGTGSQKPQYTATDSDMNGLPSIGNDSNAGSVGLDIPSFAALEIYAVMRYKDGTDSTADGYETFWSGSGSFGAPRLMLNINTSDLIPSSPYSNGVFKSAAASSSSAILPLPASLCRFVAVNTSADDWTLLYNRAYADRSWNGAVGELIALPSVASASDRQRLEGYLAHKWGLTASLPDDHPYKTYSP